MYIYIYIYIYIYNLYMVGLLINFFNVNNNNYIIFPVKLNMYLVSYRECPNTYLEFYL